jgi:hypothetical protein
MVMGFVFTFRIEEMAMAIVNNSRICCCCCWYFKKKCTYVLRQSALSAVAEGQLLLHTPLSQIEEIASPFD